MNEDIPAIEELISAGVPLGDPIESVAPHRFPPLVLALTEALPASARALIDGGSDVNAVTGEGRSPLSHTIGSVRKSTKARTSECVELLLDSGARVTADDLAAMADSFDSRRQPMFSPELQARAADVAKATSNEGLNA
jgi:hypothetical protein